MGTKFVPIQMRTLQDGLPFDFDLYVRINKKYLLYLRNGDLIDEKRLEKLRQYEGERFFIHKEDLPVFKDFVSNLLDETLEQKTEKTKTHKRVVENESGPYFDFDDVKKPETKKRENSKQAQSIKLSPHIKSMMAAQENKEGPEQKLRRQVEVVNSVAKTAIDVINKILKDPDSLVAYQVLQKASQGLNIAVVKDPAFFYQLYHIQRSQDFPLIEHTKNVALLALKTGQNLKLSSKDLENIGIASMMHDIGLAQMQQDEDMMSLFSVNKPDMSEDQKQKYSQHITHSLELLQGKSFIPQEIIDLVETHEEVITGLGPLGKTQLSLAQQTIAISNKFEKLTREQDVDLKQAINIIAINEVGNYDLKVIEALKSAVTILQRKANGSKESP